MPTYEYACEKCGHTFEQQQSIVEAPLTYCPAEKCQRKKWGKGKVRRGIGGGAGLIFKGSGFYITDYRSEGYKQAASKDCTPSAPATSTPATTAAGAKPAAAKPEAKPAASKPAKV
jgi:putative FmdB family regulatory protein